jgi:hypothetical protein
MSTLRWALLACTMLVACGPKTPPASGHGPQAGYSDDAHHEHHGKMSPELKDFHEFLAPVWHEKPGKARIEKACDSAEVLVERAKGTKDSSLVAYTTRMQEECTDHTRDEVEAWLTKVHDRFHQLMKD